jgi:O-antigen/teichoic acid export membrane protein
LGLEDPQCISKKVMYKDPERTTIRLGAKANDGVSHRLLRGFGATALGPLVTALIQLGSVPVFLHVWGAAKYGDWLLLSAIPSYLTLSDLGFGDASGSDMSMRVAANDRDGAVETFQSSWVLVTAVSLAALLLVCMSVWWIPWRSWLKLSSVSNLQAARVLLVLAAYVVLSQQNGVTESGYRSDGHFATGTFWIALLRLAEVVTATTVAMLNGSLLAVAFSYLLVRCVGTISYALLLRKISPWIRYGFQHARLTTIKKLAAPAFGFMAFPIGYALNLQGLMLVIGARLGPIAVVSFSTLRTLSRLNLQLILVCKFTLWPELSRAFGSGNIVLARRLHRHACQAALGLSIFGGLLLWIFGPFIYHLWIRQSLDFDATCFHVLLLVVVTNSLWDTSSVIPMSINAHSRIALSYSAAAALSVTIAWMLAPRFGTTGVALALFATDACMTCLVIRTSLRLVQDDLKNFVEALFAVPHFRRQKLLTMSEL